jgi:hypothetical protein
MMAMIEKEQSEFRRTFGAAAFAVAVLTVGFIIWITDEVRAKIKEMR